MVRDKSTDMADIFISYDSEDRVRVIPIVKALEGQGWSLD